MGEALNEKIAKYTDAVGKQVADSIENKTLNNDDGFEASLTRITTL
ncbi:Unknown protein sequence [Pseudomonas syringae pv. cilantro]|uniref:Uncharacterized protein n=1 Tax=Pseudomonas syringae pv. cilantro TaxID=81035 RepID=A0A0N1JP23_PSESX|nr:Unknown protein sequence [Pseudomonas syringae pv. cilantro]